MLVDGQTKPKKKGQQMANSSCGLSKEKTHVKKKTTTNQDMNNTMRHGGRRLRKQCKGARTPLFPPAVPFLFFLCRLPPYLNFTLCILSKTQSR